MSGGMNEELSDGNIGLLVDNFSEDRMRTLENAGDPVHTYTYYSVRFTIKNFGRAPEELHHISAEFTTADSAYATWVDPHGNPVPETPYRVNLVWRQSPSDPQVVLRSIEPLGEYRESVSGHFYFGETKPLCTFTLYGGAEMIVAGPFQVSLAERVPEP
jgi:hypothetical protein